MYDVIKRAPEYGLNKVYSNSQEFIEVIDTLGKEKENWIYQSIRIRKNI